MLRTSYFRQGGALRWHERPVRWIFGALFDPRPELGDLIRGEPLVDIARWHALLIGIGEQYAIEKFAIGRLAGGDCSLLEGRIALVESKLGLLHGRAMALEAAVREDRPDLAREINLLGGGARGRKNQNGEEWEDAADRWHVGSGDSPKRRRALT